jgi:methionine biosynthesis protein MetW
MAVAVRDRRFAGCYDGRWREKDRMFVERFSTILNMLSSGSSVLDVGCGNGELLRLARDEKGCRVVGADISADVLRLAYSKGVDIVRADLERALPFADKSVDTIICSEVLEHLLFPKEAMRELMRVARRNVIITVPNSGYVLDRLRLLIRGRLPVVAEGHIRFHPWSV